MISKKGAKSAVFSSPLTLPSRSARSACSHASHRPASLRALNYYVIMYNIIINDNLAVSCSRRYVQYSRQIDSRDNAEQYTHTRARHIRTCREEVVEAVVVPHPGGGGGGGERPVVVFPFFFPALSSLKDHF
eukprot:COSAG06_NODE_210_length_20171_cov_14.683489_24_plen_131_part_01